MYVCRKQRLQERLDDQEVQNFLGKYGYVQKDADYALQRLKERLAKAEGFPHEIGVFLDYPLEDVVGFIENAGQNYKCSGCWKVYCNDDFAADAPQILLKNVGGQKSDSMKNIKKKEEE